MIPWANRLLNYRRVERVNKTAMTPVTSLQQLDRFNPLGRTEFERSLPADNLRNTAHVDPSILRQDLPKRNGPGAEYKVYDQQAQVITNKPPPGSNINRLA